MLINNHLAFIKQISGNMLNSIRRRSYLWTTVAILIGIALVLLFRWIAGDERRLYALDSATKPQKHDRTRAESSLAFDAAILRN